MWLIILLILLGVLFLVAELVLLPGVSLGALFALVCYGSAIYTAFADYGPFTGGIVVLIILALSFGRDRRQDLRGQVDRCLYRPAQHGRGGRVREFQRRRAQGRRRTLRMNLLI